MLKTCPFCSSANVQMHDMEYKTDPSFHVGCLDCGGSGGVGESAESAAELWDRRDNAALRQAYHDEHSRRLQLQQALTDDRELLRTALAEVDHLQTVFAKAGLSTLDGKPLHP